MPITSTTNFNEERVQPDRGRYQPLVSIVTPSFNQARFIEEALGSVRSQSYQRVEHLIVDGMSTDGTVDLLRQLPTTDSLVRMSWVTERDSGQSEAVNKGFKLAKGEIIGWLNSDDRYRSDCFDHVVQAFEDNPEIDIIYGDYMLVDEAGRPLEIKREIDFSRFILLYHRVLYIPTTATFFRRRIFDEGNFLDESLQYAMDLEFFIRLSNRGYRFKHIPKIFADFRLQSESKTCSFPERQLLEHRQIIFLVAPALSRFQSVRTKKVVLAVLRLVAGVRRYSEKALKGYYWERMRHDGPLQDG
jgi:glycosyltransferase involved in cell wall biosynthesis